MVRHVENLKKRELFLEYFLNVHGFMKNPDKTTKKFICIDSPSGTDRFFLGGSGAIRKGSSISSSISFTDHFTEERLAKMRALVQAKRDEQKAKK